MSTPQWKGVPRCYATCSDCGQKRREEWLFWDGNGYLCFPSCNVTAEKTRKLLDDVTPQGRPKFTVKPSPMDQADWSG